MEYYYIKKFMVIIVILMALACKNNADNSTKKKAPISVEVAEVKQHDIKEYLTFNGVTLYQQKENIRSNVTGYVSWMKYKIGDPIRIGQTFATVRTKEQDALKEALKIDSTLSKFVMPQSIQSNASGVITVLNVTNNDYLAEGDILATVIQPKSLVVQVNVPYEYEDYVSVGSSCEIILQNEESIVAKITGALPTIDPVAQSQSFLIALPNEDLPENLNVQVRMVYREDAEAITVPKTAVQTNELLTEYWVLKLTNDSMAIKQMVTLKLKNASLVQIDSNGLHLGDKVVTTGGYQMQDSTIVSIQKQ
ncbi:efflux RND transporter periplasmic adaptor subunit [Maribacter sp. ACAM166]|uniref:efflux RND transporter periplasmic adaptor subunit n=1 Tax=Maribacter sp. ACAM166 TaxID=2508996 RepID=UPI0010FF3A04|nr:HlyD family efflux transporter periplasmic adaptor subunit [Maribacter sp. ACAM166]TLP70700.1 HlyD family efflux transporter periplasmic adaptor subunit [Maribacter sp. ACAM166]